ncbi:MAG: polysaccharide biosynthesis/export family protein [Armatimonadota bacterium]|nr:polysaccharide biosynthesis/export family protein [Armatimonadota bacterium]
MKDPSRWLAALLAAVAAVLFPLGALVGPDEGRAMAQSSPAPPQEYILGPGDVIEVSVLGEAELSRTAAVRPDGKINLPLLGDVQAAGTTPAQLAERITSLLRLYLRNPQVSVSVAQFRVERSYVYLVGQVVRPGPVEVQKGWTVMEVMAVSGGVTQRAALRRAHIIRRSTGQTIPIDLERLLLRADRSADVPVEPGDIIMVPSLQYRVLVLGAVRAPGAYDLDDGARILDALALAGGPDPRSATRSIGVVRNVSSSEKPQVMTVDLTKILGGDAAQNVPLQNQDVVYVPEGPLFSWSNILSVLSGLSLFRAFFGF